MKNFEIKLSYGLIIDGRPVSVSDSLDYIMDKLKKQYGMGTNNTKKEIKRALLETKSIKFFKDSNGPWEYETEQVKSKDSKIKVGK